MTDLVTAKVADAGIVSRYLNASGICKSQTGKGRVSSVSSEGFEVFKNYEGQVIVKYHARSSALKSERERFIPKLEQAMTEIAAVLTAKGYALEVYGGNGFIVTKVGA